MIAIDYPCAMYLVRLMNDAIKRNEARKGATSNRMTSIRLISNVSILVQVLFSSAWL